MTRASPHCLRKTSTVPELLTSANAAALATPGAGGRDGEQGPSLLFPVGLGQPRSSVGRSASRLIFENHHFRIPNFCLFCFDFVLFDFLKHKMLP